MPKSQVWVHRKCRQRIILWILFPSLRCMHLLAIVLCRHYSKPTIPSH
jgi:hypothetical protein